MTEFTIIEDPNPMSNEEERHYWSGRGGVEFYVQQNIPDCFEIDIVDSWGCAGGLEETLGLTYSIEKGIIDIELSELKEGVYYTIEGLTVERTRGEWGFTEDEEEYYFESLKVQWNMCTRIKQKLYNFWWQNIGHKFK